ncbi:hypothetical protein ZWY2020_006142 [Hordeum vulgare]|nr:hypothetical protein ZWY2020_006142 [Hordeum vulgare]
MGSLAGRVVARRPRFLCLHGFRTSGEIMLKRVGNWPAEVTARFDLVFADAPFPAEGKSDVDDIFHPPYYEWFQFDKLKIKEGPFDGLMGFSQGSILSGALLGLQEQGLALTRVPKIKYLIIIGGAKFRSPAIADKAYSNMIKIPSLHFLGTSLCSSQIIPLQDNDFLKPHGEQLIESFVDPFIIRHPKGHTVPRLVDETSLEVMSRFLDKMEKEISELPSAEPKAEAPADVDEKEICI